MKKITTLFLSLSIVSAFAQSISLSSSTVTVNGTTNDFVLTGLVTVSNIGTNDISITCRRVTNTLSSGHVSYFCWGTSCYPSTTSVSSTSVVIKKGANNISFNGDLNPWNNAGVSDVTYSFINDNNPSDSVSVTFEYNITLAGIQEFVQHSTISAPFPNPADKSTSINYSVNDISANYSIEIYDILGSRLASYKIEDKSGLFVIPTATLPKSLYIIAFKQNNQIVSSQRLFVTHIN